jgi:glycine cleavage system H protein
MIFDELMRIPARCQAALDAHAAFPLDTNSAGHIVNSVRTPMEKDVKVSQQHVWVGVVDERVYVGLTNFIQGAIGTVISAELPDVGDTMEEGEAFAELESVATVHEVIAPVSGKIVSVNPQLEERPSIINEDPYNDGWLVEIRLKDDAQLDALMGMDEYYHFVFKRKT